jgi:hypothetical protein
MLTRPSKLRSGVDDDEVGEDQTMASEVVLAHARCRPDGIGVTLRLKMSGWWE